MTAARVTDHQLGRRYPTNQQLNPNAWPSAAFARLRRTRVGPARAILMEPNMSTSSQSTPTDRIRALNDNLRQNISRGHGHAVMTTGISALGAEAVARICKTIEVYDDFCHANDPHQEHDFGSFDADGHTVFFKIEYYDKNLKYHSPDPADPTVTERVITIMLAEEY
jgi:uncharacterized protein DUF3768